MYVNDRSSTITYNSSTQILNIMDSSSRISTSNSSDSSDGNNHNGSSCKARKRTYSSSYSFKNSVLTTTSTDTSSSTSLSDSNGKKQKVQSTITRRTVTDQTTTTTNFTNTPIRMPSQRNVPAFLHKLFNMVDNASTEPLVRWSEDGNSFLVQGHEEFAKSVLPRFYKHNTFASFVRQLNMYDFHKVPHIQQGVLYNADNPQNEVWEFSNPNFRRNRPDLLALVTRKRNRDREEATEATGVNLASLVKEITAIKQNQTSITTDLRNLQKDNEMIWKETLVSREKHQKHQEVISKIVQFLTVVFSNEQQQIEDQVDENLLQAQKNERKRQYDNTKTYCQTQSKTDLDIPAESNISRETNEDTHSGKDVYMSTQARNMMNATGKPYSVRAAKSVITQQNAPRPSNRYTPHASSSSGTMVKPNIPENFDGASRSAKAIASDIDNLQNNVEILAAQLGIDSSQFTEDVENYGSFGDYSAMISSASENDKLRLMKLANDNDMPVLPQKHPLHTGSPHHSLQYASPQTLPPPPQAPSQLTGTTPNQPISLVFKQFLEAIDPHLIDGNTQYRSNVNAEVPVDNNCTDISFQSKVIPTVPNPPMPTTTALNHAHTPKIESRTSNVSHSEARKLFLASMPHPPSVINQRYNQHHPNNHNHHLGMAYHYSNRQPSYPSTMPQQATSEYSHHIYHNVHQLEQHMSLVNSTNNNSSEVSQYIEDANNFMNQNESKKEDGTIVY